MMKNLFTNNKSPTPEENKTLSITEKLKDSLNSETSKPLSKPLDIPDENTTVLKSNEMLNPFISTHKTEHPKKLNTETNLKKLNTGTDPKEKNKQPLAYKNTITKAPNGTELPTTTGYLSSYPLKNQNGVLQVTIDNKQSKSNILVFLTFQKPYVESKNINRKELSAVAYVKAGDKFNFHNLDSGYYHISWINLHSAKVFQSSAFAIHRDHAYAYDKMFVFSKENEINNNKVQELAVPSIYGPK